MALRKWQLKHLWMSPFMRTEAGADLYEWLTAVVLGTQSGMNRKWCYWFREHLLLCRRHGGARIPGSRIWLFQPGWSLAPVFLSTIATGRGPLVTEDRRRVATRYLAGAVDEVALVADRLSAAAKSEAPAGILLEQLREARRADSALGLCGAQYLVGGLDALAGIPSGSVDICLSMGRLEHFGASDLELLLSEMRRVLAPGGLGSHIVDHRDHLSYYDRSIHCFHHLTFSDDEWKTLGRGRKLYRNRLLEPDYARAFERAGFEVLAAVHELHRDDAAAVNPADLWGPFSELTRDDLRAAVTHFVVRAG